MESINFDENGHIICSNCKEKTHGSYIQVPKITCWNCNQPLIEAHYKTIRDLYIKLFNKNYWQE